MISWEFLEKPNTGVFLKNYPTVWLNYSSHPITTGGINRKPTILLNGVGISPLFKWPNINGFVWGYFMLFQSYDGVTGPYL